ncbi:MAG: hypothetical protein Q8P27_01680, partial [Candidatus Peregrinibacteria bacterium]|nr:hypothetical protein [Candidatus Peregrinibacteria bacterium]
KFTGHQARLLIKVILWETSTTHGAKHELTIGNEEQGPWNEISAYAHLYDDICKDTNCYYTVAFKNAQYTPIVIISPRILLENIVEGGKLLPNHPHLILDTIEQFEQTATDTFTRYFGPETFVHEEERVAILFGLLGMMSEKYADKNAFAEQIILQKNHESTPEWSKIQGSLENIESQLADPVAKAKFSALKKALSLNPAILTWIMKRMDDTPVVRACPIQIPQLLKQELWSKFKTLQLVSGFGTLEGSFKFVKKRLKLPPELEEIRLKAGQTTKPIQPLIQFHLDLPNTKSPQNLNATAEKIHKILKEEAGNATFLLMNSIKSAEQLHLKLAGSLKEDNINLLSQGMSGGLGKITQLFSQSPSQTLLIGTQKLYDQILKSEHASKITTLLIHRIPFLPPSHPVNAYESNQLSDGFNDFSLPKAILRLKQFLYEFLTQTNPEMVHILDPRFENYNGKFINSLPEQLQKA